MTPDEHEGIVRLVNEGRLLLGIDPALARKFFTQTDPLSVDQAIGEPLYVQRAVVKGCWTLSPVLAIGAAGTAIWAFGWWSLAVVPGMLLIWFFYQGMGATGATARLQHRGLLLLVFLAVVVLCFFPLVSLRIHLSAVLFLFALLCAATIYFASTRFVRLLVLRSPKAFAFLVGTVVFVVDRAASASPRNAVTGTQASPSGPPPRDSAK